MTYILEYIIIAFSIYILNVVPLFMPSTWTILSFISMWRDVPFFILAFIGALCATLGRITLAKLSYIFIREGFLKEKTKNNIDYLKSVIEKKKNYAFFGFLAYSFMPIPSNQLFIAYGLTNLKIRLLAIPFFIGRLISYTILTFSVNKVVDTFVSEDIASSTFGIYFLLVQLFTIALIYIFTKINWKKLFTEKKLGLIE